MKHMKSAKKHLTFNLLLFSCAMLLLTIYASKILASNVNSLSAETAQTGTKAVVDTAQKPTTDLSITTKENLDTTPVVNKDTPVLTQDVTKTATQTSTTTTATTTNNQKTTTKNNDSALTNVTPTFVFTSPQNGTAIETKINISGTVSAAKNVEFYLIPENSNTKKYLGTAKTQAKNSWGIQGFELRNIPNGVFFLIARIENDYGTYESGKIKITVSVPAKNQPTENSNQIASPLNTQNTEAKSNTTLENNTTTGNATPTPATAPINQDQTSDPDPQIASHNGQTTAQWQKKYFGIEACQRESYCGGNADPDNDGLNNNDESRYGTSPLSPDTDGDSYLDGVEIKNGFDPLKASQKDKTDKIVFESPKENGAIKKETYAVTNVELAKVANEKRLKLTGKGLPDSFVTIYIYSSLPIILTVKTDANGDWSYIMDKQLDDGEHEVYVAVTDNTGKITAKSEPLPFVKTAEAATAIGETQADMRAKASLAPTAARTSSDLLLIFAIILLSLGLVFSVVSLTVVYRAQKEKI
jgi:hypothetical protein